MSGDPEIIKEVFGYREAILTFMGALGGAVRSATLRTTWREGFRVCFIGGATAFGVGVLAPVVVTGWLGEIPDEMSGSIGALCATAFIVGLIAVTFIERIIDGRALGKGAGEGTRPKPITGEGGSPDETS